MWSLRVGAVVVVLCGLLAAAQHTDGVTSRELRPAQVGFYGELFDPPHSGRRPAVLVFGGSEGGMATAHHIGDSLAAAGTPALALAYFKEPGLPQALDAIPLEYFQGALQWLAAQPDIDPAHIVVMGGSRGGEAALLLAVEFPTLVHGVVALVPGNVVLCAPPPGCPRPAWTLRGSPLPYTDRFGPDPGPDPAAAIPVEQIAGPVLLVCGGADKLWPSCPMANAIIARLDAANVGYPHLLHAYPDAGHGVGILPTGPSPEPTNLQGTTPEANSPARVDAWRQVLAFVRSLG